MANFVGSQVARAAGHIRRCRYEQVMLTQILGYRPRLVWPRSFSEKLLRRKVARPPALWSILADKAAAKDFVAAKVGERHVIKTYVAADRADQVVLAALPSSFALKATHASGWNLFVRGQSDDPTEEEIRSKCGEWLRTPYGAISNETWYLSIPRRVIAEELLQDPEFGVPPDYKCWVFHGRVEFIQVDTARFDRHTRTVYDRQWRLQPWAYSRLDGNRRQAPPLGTAVPRPPQLAQLIDMAETLAAGIDFVRLDFYCPSNSDILFGEYTFLPAAGWGCFPESRYDYEVGRLW